MTTQLTPAVPRTPHSRQQCIPSSPSLSPSTPFFLTLHTIYTPTGCICTHVPSGCTDILSRVRSTRLTHLRASAQLAKGEPVMSTGNGWPHYHHHTHSYTRCCGCVRRAHRLYTPATTLRTSTSAKGVDAPRPSRTPATRTALSLHTRAHAHRRYVHSVCLRARRLARR